MPGQHGWTFITSHGAVLIEVANHPDATVKELSAQLDITQRQIFRVLSDLVDNGYVVREKIGTHNHYRVNEHLPRRRINHRNRPVRDLIKALR